MMLNCLTSYRHHPSCTTIQGRPGREGWMPVTPPVLIIAQAQQKDDVLLSPEII